MISGIRVEEHLSLSFTRPSSPKYGSVISVIKERLRAQLLACH